MTVKPSNESINQPGLYGSYNKHSTRMVIEHQPTINKIAEENPDLPPSFIKDILLSKQEVAKGNVKAYKFG